jgi:hypothetical protein
LASYLVIRLVPDSPVDGGTFSSYLNDLIITVYPAVDPPSTAPALGTTKNLGSNLTLTPIPWDVGAYVASASAEVTTATAQSGGNFGTTLTVDDVSGGIAFGSGVTCVANSSLFPANTTVTAIPLSPAPLTLSQTLTNFVALGTSATFYFLYDGGANSPSISPVYTGSTPSFSFDLPTSIAANGTNSLGFSSTYGISVGMEVTAPSIPTGTTVTVTAVPSSTSVTVSQNVTVGAGKPVTFTWPLNLGIVQHVEPIVFTGPFDPYVPVPMAVATAVISIATPPSGSFLDISVVATRGGIPIPVSSAYYNVIVTAGSPPTTPDQIQAIPDQQTSLYLTLPPTPPGNSISPVIPSDGTPPAFDGTTGLLQAMQQALSDDPYFATQGVTDLSALTPDLCTRMAYDIVWSQQNALPLPPDPLESLYTNPPNPGGSTGSSSDSTNNLEQDRIKFEGNLNSFYSTRNATAERLTKFVAAASAAIYCEQISLNSTAALLEFPVDPSSTFVTEVESELLLQGLGLNGTAGINFGVPAAFFYALGASLDKGTAPIQRFQLATGDAIERLLQQFATAESSGVITDTESFVNPSSSLKATTSFQAARRLVALKVSAASTSPAVAVAAGSPLASLVSDWLLQLVPAATSSSTPPLTYENQDFNIWTQQLAPLDPQGYLYLDLDALTEGYIIPPFSSTPSLAAASGSQLMFAGIGTTGIGVGMPVIGTNIPAGTTVQQCATVVVVTPNQNTVSPVVAADVITFGSGATSIAASNGTSTGPAQLTFPASAATMAIAVGMSVAVGAKIKINTSVLAVAPTTVVTLSSPVTGSGVTTSTPVSIGGVTPITTKDCPSGTSLTFAGAGATDGIANGMLAIGPNIVPGTLVTGVAAPVVTLSTAVAGDVPLGSQITFVTSASLLSYQIAQWLPSTTTAAPPPTVATLKQVKALQWTNFFTYTGGQNWLPPFTQPVAPGASPPAGGSAKAGYIALRIRSFVRAVQQFFTVSSVATAAQLPGSGAPPVFGLLPFDPITQAVNALPGPPSPPGSPFTFPGTLTSANLTTAVTGVFPYDPAARAWLAQALTTINELFEVTSTSVTTAPTVPNPYTLPNKVSFGFSLVEALYARGFRSAKDITALSSGDFQQALTGTVAYDFAGTIYTDAQSVPPSSPSPSQPQEPFQPINPDGSLVNCIPPPCLSPTGPIAYLQDMLKLSPESTCENPWAAPATGELTLGDAVTARRGALGTLLATCANLETPLPLIDIVNECLEYLGAAQPPPAAANCGTVYNTSADELAGYRLCRESDCAEERAHPCHDPAAIFAALPEYSTPATPVASANQGVEPLAYNNLKSDFSACDLPYSQALDVSRTYLRHFGTCRYEELRTFRKCITEFALNPDNPPTGFQSYLWRYPVRIETAIEYLGLTPEEYTLLFQGTAFQPCASARYDQGQPAVPGSPQSPTALPTASQPAASQAPTSRPAASQPPTAQAAPRPLPTALLFGQTLSGGDRIAPGEQPNLARFLAATCLTYCEFLELWKLIYIQSAYAGPAPTETGAALYPDCEPCCLSDYPLYFPDGVDREQALTQLLVFIRLWRKLRDVCGARYSFQALYDICFVLQLFTSGSLNPEFIRQLAAFQMLRDQFHLPLRDESDHTAGVKGADRTHLLALWVGSSAKKWRWAVSRLLEGVENHARVRYGCTRPRGESIAHMSDNLDALSRLAGFNPPTATNPSTDTWNSTPGCTLRFAEILAKICASAFRIDELLYLFNAAPPEDDRHLFPTQEPDEALSFPLDLPDDERDDSLWRLRESLLAVEPREAEAREWSWRHLVAELREKFGYAPPSGQDPLLSIGQHFFPEVLEASGYSVSAAQRRYTVPLTSSTAWNSPGSPFHYDAGSNQLSIQLPLSDEAVAATLSQLPALNSAEQIAVQDLYFAPRVDLAFLTFVFPDWESAERQLIQERDERKRWDYFRHHVGLANARRRVIGEHLARHVARRTGCHREGLEQVSELVLSRLWADENSGAPWESDSGVPPAVMWTQTPAGGAIAALLGLTGTGLVGEYVVTQAQGDSNTTAAPGVSPTAAAQVVWRDVRGPFETFGHGRDHINSAVPTVIPSLGLVLAANPLVSSSNGYAVRVSDGMRLGGAQGFRIRWSGVLLIEKEGEYAFHAGAPTGEGERPDLESARNSQWLVTLQRGQKTTTILNHQWPGNTSPDRAMPRLRRGAYDIAIEYSQPAPDFSGSHIHPQHTGFQVKYAGPDSDDCLVALPLARLYRDFKNQTLDQGVQFLPGSHNAQAFLKAYYTSTLRDMRRTYQRAFKAVLFAGKLGVAARPADDDCPSELGYLLANATRFAGAAYYRTSSTAFTQHLANFDFNFLPLQDNYHAPVASPPDRSTPSLQRTQAMFDWWERIFDYDRVRKDVHRSCDGRLWRLFEEALVNPPTDVTQLLRFIGADARYRELALRFYQDQAAPIYSVGALDLQDERWLVRVWHADRWIRGVLHHFHANDVAKARPDLWAALDPSAPVPLSGTTETGNANLLRFLTGSCFANGEPRRYTEVTRLNDGLRERGRNALVSYLCAQNRVPLTWLTMSTFATSPRDLSDLLLLDVETGLCEKTSRIEEAIAAVQAFVRRSRLGLEPDWKVRREFARLWDDRFESYRTWERCRRRELYRENWIEWFELGKARRIEAFRFLESSLRSATLTLAAPGGLDWWADDDRVLEQEPELLQRRVPSELSPLAPPPQSTTREGLGTLGRPEYVAQHSWLAAVPQASASTTTSSGTTSTGTTSTGTTTPGTPTPGATSTGTTPLPGATTLAATPTSQQAAPASAPASASASTASTALATTGHALVLAAATASAQPRTLPFWMESAIKLGTRFLRVAAAGIPQASLAFAPHRSSEPHGTCCRECNCEHPALVDEYYFWLINTEFYQYTDQTDAQSSQDASFNGSYQFGFQDSYYDPYQQQSAEWNDEDQVPGLLARWLPSPAVRLCWCRVHNGEFGQPRRSDCVVPTSDPPDPSNPVDLIFLGRAGDSLYFEVNGSPIPSPPRTAPTGDTSPPGFRYDLPTDQALALPQVLVPPPPTTTYPGGLLSYPFFAYDEPGARLFPGAWFAPSAIVADTLRTHCRFELALKWYQRSFDPLKRDCTWMDCSEETQTPTQPTAPTNEEIATAAYYIWEQHGRPPAEQTQDWLEAQAALKARATRIGGSADQGKEGACCDSALASEEVARHRAVTLQFCETLLDWSDSLMRCRRSPEAFQQARLLCDTAGRITGRHPRTVVMPEPTTPTSVAAFVPAYAPLNPRLLDLYDRVVDRRALIHNCQSARRLRNGRLGRDMNYFGDNPLREGWRTVAESCADEDDCCCGPSPYRFVFLIQKATEHVGRLRELEGALLAAYEKGDAECLAAIRAGQEREMLALDLSIRQDQWRDADWQVQALQQTKDVNQANLIYYNSLYQNGLINDEIQNLTLATNAMQTRTDSNITEAIGEAMTIVPDFFVGAMSTFTQVPIGTKLAALFGTIAKVMQTVADIQAATAAIDLTEANWQRRSDEWFHQMQTLPIEIQQTEVQILGAQRRRAQALQELNNQQRQIENAAEVQDFLRDKFTSTELYLWLQKETLGLRHRMHKLARCAALEAQRAYNFERGHTTRRFIPEECEESLRETLLSGQRLGVALSHMEQTYLDENVREYELTKHFSLRLHFPFEFLRLKATGSCEIELLEWMFDLDYPGHYMRRIRSVSLTIPCVTGPFTGVHCRATLLSSVTRIDPRLEVPATHCCCECRSDDGYEACPHDLRVAHTYGAREAIATSSGQNDSGLFELNFHDERYLPFEFQGTVSRWRIELPVENNAFRRETLADLHLHVNLTSREGGELLRRAANAAAQKHLPGAGWCFFDVRHEFPDAWQLLRSSLAAGQAGGKLSVRLERKQFPFVPGADEISVGAVALLFHPREDECADRPLSAECPCPQYQKPASRTVELIYGSRGERLGEHTRSTSAACLSSEDWRNLYYGLFETHVGRIGKSEDGRVELTFRFPPEVREVESVFLLCHYERSGCEHAQR